MPPDGGGALVRPVSRLPGADRHTQRWRHAGTHQTGLLPANLTLVHTYNHKADLWELCWGSVTANYMTTKGWNTFYRKKYYRVL